MGFAGHAHTMNELETDPQRDLELKSRNSPEEAKKLVGMILGKLEKDLLDSDYRLEDVKLLILYLSYRGEPVEKDTQICGSILRDIENTRIHNYRIETVFMKIKDRVIDFRGLKALWSAPILITAIVIQHNFIENHSTTDEVPSERAGVNLELGENGWLDLIRKSSFSL